MVPILMPAERLKASLEEVAWLGIKGFSITIPHKEAVLPLLNQADGAVDRVGFVQHDGRQGGRHEGRLQHRLPGGDGLAGGGLSAGPPMEGG